MPSALPTVSRRGVLLGAAALALLGTTSACGSKPPPPDVDDLLAQLDRARSDSRLAARAATSTRPPVAAALNVVAAERTAHGKAISEEITRVSGETPTSSTSASPTTTSAEPPESVPPPTLSDVVAALKQSADGAGQAAVAQSGYRAGLFGSIAASCTAAYTVALPGTPS